jgi:hypothetical protein
MAVGLPAFMAGLPGNGIMLWVGPPFNANGPRFTVTPIRFATPFDTMQPLQSEFEAPVIAVFSAMMVLLMVGIAVLAMSSPLPETAVVFPTMVSSSRSREPEE